MHAVVVNVTINDRAAAREPRMHESNVIDRLEWIDGAHGGKIDRSRRSMTLRQPKRWQRRRRGDLGDLDARVGAETVLFRSGSMPSSRLARGAAELHRPLRTGFVDRGVLPRLAGLAASGRAGTPAGGLEPDLTSPHT